MERLSVFGGVGLGARCGPFPMGGDSQLPADLGLPAPPRTKQIAAVSNAIRLLVSSLSLG